MARPVRLALTPVLGALAVLACSAPPAYVEIRVNRAGHPVHDLELTLLPYDPVSLLDSLARAASTPRPVFTALEEALADYQRPDLTAAGRIHQQWQQARARVQKLADSLTTLPRATPAYIRRYGTFREAYDRLLAREAELSRSLERLIGPDRDLARRAGRAADSLRTWEDNALAVFDSLAAARIRHAGRRPVTVRTSARGVATTRLAPGNWWITARVPDPANPFLETAWHTGFTVAPLIPTVVPLTDRDVIVQWRH